MHRHHRRMRQGSIIASVALLVGLAIVEHPGTGAGPIPEMVAAPGADPDGTRCVIIAPRRGGEPPARTFEPHVLCTGSGRGAGVIPLGGARAAERPATRPEQHQQ